MLDEDWLCGHDVDALAVIARERSGLPLAGVVVCRDCGAELRVWVSDDEPRYVAAGTTAG